MTGKAPHDKPLEVESTNSKFVELGLDSDCWEFSAMTMLYAGLRKGEVLALNWSNIDFEKEAYGIIKLKNRVNEIT